MYSKLEVSLILSVRKAVSWYNSFLEKFLNMLYCMAFIPEALIWRFQSVWVPTCGQINIIKIKYPVHIKVFGVIAIDGDVMLTLIFLHDHRLNMKAYIKCQGEGSTAMDWEGDCWMTLSSNMQTGKSSFGGQKIFVTISPQTSDNLIAQITISLIIMCWAQLSERPTKHQATPKMNWRQG